MTTRKDKKFKYGEAMRFIARPPSTLSKQDKKSIVDGFYKRQDDIDLADQRSVSMENELRQLSKLNHEKTERLRDYAAKERLRKYEVAGIKDSALYKLLENPKVFGVELGHETILEIINLIQNTGLVKKPEKEIDHIALLDPKEII